jgi:hypothetical protein
MQMNASQISCLLRTGGVPPQEKQKKGTGGKQQQQQQQSTVIYDRIRSNRTRLIRQREKGPLNPQSSFASSYRRRR